MSRRAPRAWSGSPERAALLALYAEADALVAGRSCRCSAGVERPDCCHFAVTGREPYPTAVELAEVRHGLERSGRPASPERRRVALADDRRCPLLVAGRCSIYESRPFGCRTFFCPDAEGARLPRRELLELGRRIADLSSRFAPHDPRPRPLLRALLDAPRPPNGRG